MSEPVSGLVRGIALLSGGLDSGVAAASFAAVPGQSLTLCLFFDYGQRAARREAMAAAALARRRGVPWQSLAVPWLGELAARAGSALLPGVGSLPVATAAAPGDASSAAAVWVPARNAVFVAIAAAHAEAQGADRVVAGFNREEAATFADNSPQFVAAADEFLRHGTRNAVRVVSPTQDLDKAGIVALAKELGYTAGDFWSCYAGGERPCGRCESCVRSRWDRSA